MTTLRKSPGGVEPAAPSVMPGRPGCSPAEAAALARSYYGLEATAHPLPSDRDQNFRLQTASGESFVLKIASAFEDRRVLEAQNALLQHLAGRKLAVPAVCPAQSGATIETVPGSDGATHFLRLLTFLPGVPFARVNPHAPDLLHDVGRFLGTLDAALVGFDHPGTHRHLSWDLQHAGETIARYLPYVDGAERRAHVERHRNLFTATMDALAGGLRRSVIHGDANDYNVLVTPPTAPARRVAGLIDFGDVVYSYTVGELAVATAYVMLDKPDPLAAAGRVARGYHEAFPLAAEEVEVLFSMICMRLCVSVVTSAYQRQLEPENDYLGISEQPAWRLLARLAAVHPRQAHYAFRAACGLPPCPHTAAIVSWLRVHRHRTAPVVRADLERALVLDLSVGSPDLAAVPSPQAFAADVSARMAAGGADVAVGRYDEPRLVYTAEQFRTEGDARRTVHLGIDLFQPAGAPVFAPLDGVVHSLADNARPLDYGPTIILKHRPEEGPVFYTLYGHLSAASLDGLREGQPVAAGAQLATLGDVHENGGWAPHLHFQLITDLLDRAGDFPGVAAPDERAVWLSLSPDPNVILGIPAGRLPAPPPSPAETLQARGRHLAPSLSLSYRRPLKIVRGLGAYLYDEDGRAYLDCVNNVAHVGHSHPHVVGAAQRQMAVLNTNTRYLHDNVVRYAERLTALLPEPLRVCFFVNSGSEANDLALRLARTRTGRRGVVVLEGAYHGHLTSLIEISPYKHDGPGGRGAPSYVHAVPVPDPYCGRYRAPEADLGARYGSHVREALARAADAEDPAAAFIAESVLSCGGQVVLPEGFLQESYRHTRAAGGVCIADEVQVGFGRVGAYFWGFETQGVVPDVVTMGKPIGNGHPLAAVVTTPEIAAAFNNGMEYFNTYGGNPVSCAVGLAVLDVIEAEGLQEQARQVGAHLLRALQRLQEKHPLVGDVRGLGLFVGVELVRDRTLRTPAAAQAAHLVNRMKDEGILLSTDGPRHNVIKIKPPLVFSAADADRLADTLDRILAEDFLQV